MFGSQNKVHLAVYITWRAWRHHNWVTMACYKIDRWQHKRLFFESINIVWNQLKAERQTKGCVRGVSSSAVIFVYSVHNVIKCIVQRNI